MSEHDARAWTLPIEGVLYAKEVSADPPDPPDGAANIWLSDGTGSGNDGDLMMERMVGGSVVQNTLHANAIVAGASPVYVQGVAFVEASAGTSYTATVEIPAGALVHDVGFTTTVLWDGTSASLIIGDDDDPNGWFVATNLKATNLLVGEVLSAADDGTWGGLEGAYLTSAGRRGRVTAGVDSGWYYGAASEVIFLVTPGAADGTAGRSFGWVKYSVPTFTASTNV